MKKLLGLLLVITLAWPASADVLKNVNLIGEIQTIASDVNHNTKPTAYYNDGVHTRVLAGLSANLVEDVTANILFQYADTWNGNMDGDTINDYEGRVRVSNANVVLSNLFDCLEATVGRQFYGDEDSAVMYVGPNHYNAEARNAYAQSLDAVKLTYADDVKAFTFIAGKVGVVEGVNVLGGAADGTKVIGGDFRLNVTDVMKLQAYIYNFENVTVVDPDRNTDKDAGLYGAKLTVNPEPVLFSVEYARNYGGDRLIKEHKDTGYMLKADAAINVEEFTLRGAFLYEQENFYAWGNYTPGLIIGHRLGGQIGDYSGEGVRMFNAGVDFSPAEKWTFALDGYAFQDRYGHHAATWEGDLTAKYAHNEYVQLFAGLGYAKYGTDQVNLPGFPTYKNAFHKDNFKWQLGMLINF